jgi:hypothetical protein
MTLLSCLVIGIAFGIAILLLLLAGALIGWNLPRLVSGLRGFRGSRGSSGRRSR